MSYDFPDGPDYNPEPIDNDPWDVNTTTPEAPEGFCWVMFKAPEGYSPQWHWGLQPILEEKE